MLLGLILFGDYPTIKAKHFPEEKPIKIIMKDLKIGETYQVSGTRLTFKNIEVIEERNESAWHGHALQATYIFINDTEDSIYPRQWSIENKNDEGLCEYGTILDNPERIENGREEAINYYYKLPTERQDY